MDLNFIVVASAVLLGLYLVSASLQRGFSMLAARLDRQRDALQEFQERYAVATIAGLLVGHRLSSPAYEQLMSQNRALKLEALTGGVKAVLAGESSAADTLQQWADQAEATLKDNDIFGAETRSRFIALASSIYNEVLHQRETGA